MAGMGGKLPLARAVPRSDHRPHKRVNPGNRSCRGSMLRPSFDFGSLAVHPAHRKNQPGSDRLLHKHRALRLRQLHQGRTCELARLSEQASHSKRAGRNLIVREIAWLCGRKRGLPRVLHEAVQGLSIVCVTRTHDSDNLPRIADVRQWISVEENQIGAFACTDTSSKPILMRKPGREDGC